MAATVAGTDATTRLYREISPCAFLSDSLHLLQPKWNWAHRSSGETYPSTGWRMRLLNTVPVADNRSVALHRLRMLIWQPIARIER